MFRLVVFIVMIMMVGGIMPVNRNKEHRHGCHTNASSPSHQMNVDSFILSQKRTRSISNLCKQCIVIDTYMTIFLPTTSNTSTFFLNEATIATVWKEQMSTLNEAFAESPFRFDLKENEPTIVQNDIWHADFFANRQEYAQSWPITLVQDHRRKGDYQALNLYFGAAVQEDYYGFATYPQPGGLSVAPIDGVYCSLQALPNNATSDCCRNNDPACCSFGYTAVHEVGHWLGLEHTFATQTGIPCDPNDPNDFVADTPQQRYPTWEECPSKPRDSCPNLPGYDPFTNVMDYAFDSCIEPPFFTPGQVERMWYVWQLYRRHQNGDDCPELIELLLVGNAYYWELSGSDRTRFRWNSRNGNFDWHRPAPLVNHVDICWHPSDGDFQLSVTPKKGIVTNPAVFPSYWYLRYQDRDIIPILSENTMVISSVNLTTTTSLATTNMNLKDFLSTSPQYSLFLRAIGLAPSWVEEVLRDGFSRLTLMIPDNEALEAIVTPSPFFNNMLLNNDTYKEWEEQWACFVTSYLTPWRRTLDESGIADAGYGNVLFWTKTDDGVVVNDVVSIMQPTSILVNGIAYGLSLLPTATVGQSALPSCLSQNLETKIKNDKKLSMFIELLERADLQDLLSSSSPRTVFVPTNEAFEDLKYYYYDGYYYYSTNANVSLWDHMLQDVELLIQVLKLHMIPSNQVFSSRMMNQTYSTMGSRKNDVELGMHWEDIYNKDPAYGIFDGSYYAKVLESNHICSNGIFHIIDIVLFPLTEDATAITTPSNTPTIRITMTPTLWPTISPIAITAPTNLLPTSGGIIEQQTPLPTNFQPIAEPSTVSPTRTPNPVATDIPMTPYVSLSTRITSRVAILLAFGAFAAFAFW